MPSPFPGMDPFIENQEWEDFHTTFNTAIREQLLPEIEPRYVVRVERRVYVEHLSDEPLPSRSPDVSVLLAESDTNANRSGGSASSATIAPVECELPMPEERRETFLVIRECESMEVVTVLETLSPANKRNGDGRRQYLAKREAVLESQSNLVELDLLRGGPRLPSRNPLPVADYYAIVSRPRRRPKADVYAWTMQQTLPAIPVPLKGDDPDVMLNLQSVFETVYERARYDLTIDYRAPLVDADQEWLSNLLQQDT